MTKPKFKTVCESSWHDETELKPLEECPICHSASMHLSFVVNEKDKKEDEELDSRELKGGEQNVRISE